MSSIADKQVDSRGVRCRIGSAILSAALDTAVVYGALGWWYVAVIAMLCPSELALSIVSWVPIRQDTLGIMSFGVSGVGYFIRELRRPSVRHDG